MFKGKPLGDTSRANTAMERRVKQLSFSTKEESLAGIKQINSDYNKHCKIAPEIAANYFSHEKVLSKLFGSFRTKL